MISRGHVFSGPLYRGSYLLENTGSVASEAERSDKSMCFTRNDRRFEEEVRNLRSEEDARRRGERNARPVSEESKKGKPLTEEVKEIVGAK